jgi:acyl carrier protein
MKTLESAFRPKVLGAWLLHQLTREMDLDFFVLFSSGAAVWGSKDLAHYAAANLFLDTLAHYRQSLSLPALSINWGWWAGGGTTKEMEHYFAQIGLNPMSDDDCFEALYGLLKSEAVQSVVSDFDWNIFGPVLEATKRRPLLERILIRGETSIQHAEKKCLDVRRRLEEAPPGERWDLLLAHVRAVAAQVLGFGAPELLDPKQGFFSMGMDSIMTLQLKNRLEIGLGEKLPRTVAFEYPNIEALTTYLATRVLSLQPTTECLGRQPVEDGSAAVSAERDELSEEELVELLSKKLKHLQ